MRLEGSARIGGRPAEGLVLLACAATPPQALAASESRTDGSFALELPDGADGVLVSARGPAVAVGWFAPAGGDLDLPEPPHRLTVEVEGDAPGGGVAWVEPLAVDGVPAELAPLFARRTPSSFDFHFAELPLAAAEFRVAPGRYEVGAAVPVPDGPLMRERPRGMQAERAEAGGTALPARGPGAFVLDVSGDVVVRVRLREI